MSITVQLWSQEELESLQKDKWLATIFMNGNTFSEQEIKHYPYNLRRTYLCEWLREEESTRIYATDQRMLLKFIDAEYTRRPDLITQIITQYRPLEF